MAEPFSFLDERQRRVHGDLDYRRPELAATYAAALELLYGTPWSLAPPTRISYICHSMREVMNGVLRAMGTPATPKVSPSTKKLVQDLPDLLAAFPTLDLESDGELVQIPRGVAEAMGQLFKAAVGEKSSSRENVASLLTDDGNFEHAAVTKWIDARQFFVKWVHLGDRQYRPDQLPDDNEILAHVAVFEELFDGVITAFFTNKKVIDDLLAEINSTEDEIDA